MDESRRRPAVALAILGTVFILAACGAAQRPMPSATIPGALLRGVRPIGVGPRFAPPATGPVLGLCRRALGPRTAVHVELFAADRVILVAAGIGTRPPRATSATGLLRARCYGALVTLQPTGVVYFRRGLRLRLSALFRSWGQPLSRSRLVSFRAGRGASVAVYVGGRRWSGAPGDVPLTPHAEIVLEVGPHIPPHTSFTFAPTP